MEKWTDSTSYSRGDTERKPRSYTLNAGSISIIITKGHIDYKGLWVMHCYALGMKTVRLNLNGDADLNKVKRVAIDKVREKLNNLTNDLNKAIFN